MKISIKQRPADRIDGWLFIPVTAEKNVPPAVPAHRPGVPRISADEWNCAAEAVGHFDGFQLVKTPPVPLDEEIRTTLPEALGTGLKRLSARKAKHLAIVLPDQLVAPKFCSLLSDMFMVPDLFAHEYAPYKTAEDDRSPGRFDSITFLTGASKEILGLESILARSRIIATAVNLARRLSDAPGNALYPEKMAEEAVALATSRNLRVRIRRGKELNLFGGLLAVGGGSANPPCLIEMELNPGRTRPVLLVGKGVTFDSGGISIKPAEKMHELRNDMAGGAAVMAALSALAQTGCRRRVIGLIPAAENLPDGGACRPGDVIRQYDGQTVEIMTTDGEGRLILADALAYGASFHPEFTIDLATLTGAIVTALGDTYTGLFTRDAGLQNQILSAAETAGDLVWPMPLHKTFTDAMKSSIADWKNAGGRKAGACLAAAFLSSFAPAPWAHLDIAGTADQVRERSFLSKGSSGVGVRLLVELLNPAEGKPFS